MKKIEKMGFFGIILLGINSIIGSGIFLLPSNGYKLFGPASALTLVFDGLLALSIALCFAECSGLFDENGGPLVYTTQAFGNFVGFEVGFVTWAIRIIAEGTIYVGFATALGGIFPALNTTLAKNVIVTILAFFLATLNISGVRNTSIVNNVITIAKLVPILMVAIIGVFAISAANFHPFFIPKLTTTSNFANASMTMFYIFTGFESLTVAASEMKNPERNLPRAMVITMTAVVIIYLLVMVACIGVLGSQLTNSTVPLQDTLKKVVGPWGGTVVAIGTILSIGGICISSSFVTPRSGAALAEHKMMPAVLGKRNTRNAPYVAIIVSTTISLLLAYSGTFNTLAQISAVSRFAQYIPTCLSVIVFRRTRPNQQRVFKLPLGWTIPIVAVIVSLWLLFKTPVVNLIWGLGALVIAVPFYFLMKHENPSL